MTEWLSLLIKILGIFLTGLLMIFLGKYDQKKRLVPWVKLLLQGMIAILVVSIGIKIEFLRDSSGGYWYLASLSIPVTILWLLVITNSVGHTDEFAQTTPTVVFVASLTFLFVSIFQRQGLILAEILSLVLILFSLAIIYLKRKNPQKTSNYFSSFYMFFGFILAIIAIVGVSKSTAALTLLTPLLILGFPIADASYYFITGYLSDEYLGQKNESSLKQKLVDQGFSREGANVLIVVICIYLSLIAVIVSVWEDFYLFAGMTGLGYLVYFWLKKQVIRGENVIEFDKDRQKVALFGVPIDRICCQEAVEKLDLFVNQRQTRFVVTPDTLAVLRAKKDKQYLEITQKADLVTPDGAGVLWASATLDHPLIERITGIDLINQICQLAVKKGYRLYLLGAKEGIIEKAAGNLIKQYPGIHIVGYHHGYFSSDQQNKGKNQSSEKELIQEIKKKKPDFLLVGMGVPKQEFWIQQHKKDLDVPVCIGIGGSFDVLSGKIPRAPLWMQNHGMEWIFRLIKEPKRIKRAIALPYFMWLVFLGKIESFFRISE